MKQTSKKTSDPASPRQQNRWDWRAATNFIVGGAGGGLLLGVSLVALEPLAARAAIFLGLALIGSGLLCVWFEIGRPWRALNVYRHFASSWMTREAVAAALLFASGGLALLTLQAPLVLLTSSLGLAFVYCQARMLGANKGIPAWRQPRSIPLMLATGLAEGAGFLACILAISNPAGGLWPLAVLLALILLRALFWKRFLAGLATGGAPDGSLQVLKGMDPGFMAFGHALPLLAVLGALTGIPGRAGLIFLAGTLVIACGWWFKFTLVRRAAFTQGLALLHLPMYGHGETDLPFRPGWKVAPGPGTGP
ncbi:MAG TPA: DmsC/YnfH family molybdoenzyme membrane anchor subunit [Xanthomonadales bacterium]|nr:DmsC/YnfH family molybdoenzyme membrane anchor subunit [Xanthomonadales bacterium]